MITSVSIENFRCFDSLTVEPLGRINLVTGLNGVGKTSLLEPYGCTMADITPCFFGIAL